MVAREPAVLLLSGISHRLSINNHQELRYPARRPLSERSLAALFNHQQYLLMIAYLARQYFINALVFVWGLSIIPILSGWNFISVIHQALFWGGIFGAIYTFYYFKKRNVWPLFDNLKYPRYLLLSGFFLSLQILNISIGVFS